MDLIQKSFTQKHPNWISKKRNKWVKVLFK